VAHWQSNVEMPPACAATKRSKEAKDARSKRTCRGFVTFFTRQMRTSNFPLRWPRTLWSSLGVFVAFVQSHCRPHLFQSVGCHFGVHAVCQCEDDPQGRHAGQKCICWRRCPASGGGRGANSQVNKSARKLNINLAPPPPPPPPPPPGRHRRRRRQLYRSHCHRIRFMGSQRCHIRRIPCSLVPRPGIGLLDSHIPVHGV
jgi:hypothetical protein